MKKTILLVISLFILGFNINVNATARVCYYKDSTGKEVLALSINNDDGHPQVTPAAVNNSMFANYKLRVEDWVSYDYFNCPSYIQYFLNGSEYIIGGNLTYYSKLGMDVANLSFSRNEETQQGNNAGNKSPNYDLGIFGGVTGNETCPAIFGSASDPDSIFGFMSKYIFTPIRWLTPIVLIVLTSLDFAKAIFMDEKDGMGKAKGNFGKRAVAALIIFLAPTIVSILLTLIDGANVSECMNNIEIGNL